MTFAVRESKSEIKEPIITYIKGKKYQRFPSLSRDLDEDEVRKEVDIFKVVIKKP